MNINDTVKMLKKKVRLQKLPALGDGGGCSYLTDKGLQCPVGLALGVYLCTELKNADRQTDHIWSLWADFPIVRKTLHISGYTQADALDFWTAVQEAHDGEAYNRQESRVAFPERFNVALDKVLIAFERALAKRACAA